MRVVNRDKRYITYTLNILGLRVFEGVCELVARDGNDWVSIGNTKPLPIRMSDHNDSADPLLLTISQYTATFPDSDLVPVLEGRRSVDQALGTAQRRKMAGDC